MKILVVLPTVGRGGAERVALELAAQWQRDHAVNVLALHPTARSLESPAPIEILGGASHRSIVRKLAAPILVIRLCRYLRRERPDAVVSFMEGANLPVAAASRLVGFKRRVLLSVRTDFRQHRRLTRLLMSKLYPGIHVSAPSTRLVESLHAAGLTDPEHGHVLPSPLIADRGEGELPTDLPPAFVLGMGRLAPEKDFALLLRAYAIALGQPPVPDLVIAGEGPLRAELHGLAVEMGIGDRVHFPGFCRAPGRLFGRASMFVLTSRREGWPLVLLEALAAGCPVAAVDCETGPRDILGREEYGLLVEGRDPEKVAAAMVRLLTDTDLVTRLREAGPKRAEEHESARVAARWLEVLAARAQQEPTISNQTH